MIETTTDLAVGVATGVTTGVTTVWTFFLAFLPSICVCLFLLGVRFAYKNWLLKLLHHLGNKYDSNLLNALLDAGEEPFNFFLNIFNITTTIAWLPQAEMAHIFPFVTTGLMAKVGHITDQIQRSALIYCIFWCLYNISDATHYIMGLICKSIGLHPESDHLTLEDQKARCAISVLMSTLLRFLIILIGFVIIAHEWGYDVSAFLASLSIGSAAVALAAKDAIANVFGGLVLIIGRPFVVGDWIKVNDAEGIVEKINMRTTAIRTFPSELIYIPNSLMTNTAITNFTNRKKRRLSMTLGVEYSTTREQMEKMIADLRAYFQSKPESFDLTEDVRVHFTAYNDFSLDIGITVYILTNGTMNLLNVTQQLNLDILDIAKKNGVSFAFPSQSIYFADALKMQKESAAQANKQ